MVSKKSCTFARKSNSKHWFTTSFFGGRCRKAMLVVCVALQSNSKHWFTTSFLNVCPPVWVSRKATLPGCCPQIKNNISFYVYDAVHCGPTDFVACSLAWRRQLCNRKNCFYFSVYNRRSTRISVHFYSSFDTSTDIVWFIRRAGAGMRTQVHRSVHTTPDLWRFCFWLVLM